MFLLGPFPALRFGGNHTHVLAQLWYVFVCYFHVSSLHVCRQSVLAIMSDDDLNLCIMSAASMKSSKLWLDAISQNAWDTGKYTK